MSTGNDFTSYEIINTYRTLLYASSTTPSSVLVNEGFTTNLKDIRSGDGTNSPLQISSDYVNINGPSKLMLDGTILTASASTLNALVSLGTVTKITTGNDTILFTEGGVSVSTASTSLTAVVNPTLSITNLYASTGIFLAGSAIPSTGDVAAVSALTSVNKAAITSVNTVVTGNTTNITANTAAITSVNTSVVANTAAITSINTVVTGNTTNITANAAAITSINTSVVANTTAITSVNAVIATVSALTSVNKTAITSINTVVTGNTTNITANTAAITSVNTSVVANTAAITSVNTVISAVSALTSVNKAAITSINAGPASTFDALTVKTSITIGGTGSGNGVKALNIESPDNYSILEIGGPNGAFVDLKAPFSDDYDTRLRVGSIDLGNTGDTFSIRGPGPETLATFTDDGSVALYHNNVKKLETAADGVDVDDINLNGKVLTITGDTGDTFTITTGADGSTTIRTIDAAGADAFLSLVADGVIEFNSNNPYGSILLDKNSTNYGEFYSASDSFSIRNNINDGDLNLNGKDGSSFITALKLDMSEAGKAIFNAGATFADAVTVEDISLDGKVLTITGDTGDTFTITSGANGATTLATVDTAGAVAHLTLDADGVIVLDGGDAQGSVFFKNNNTTYATMYNSGNNLYLKSEVSDGDLILQGNDGGVAVAALTLDMSEAGKATFNDGATFNGDVTLTGDAYNVVWDKSENSLEFADNARAKFGNSGDLEIWHDGSNSNIKSGGAGSLIIQSNFSETAILVVPNGQVRLYYDNAQKLETTATGATVTGGIVADSATVDDISLDGKVITITGDTSDTFKISSGTNGATTLATVDTDAASAHLTLDADGVIFLDAGDGNGILYLKNSGTTYGSIFNTGNDHNIKSEIADGDIHLRGNDGGSAITALTLDMSEAGAATFNSNIKLPDDGTIGTATTPGLITLSSNNVRLTNTATDDIDAVLQLYSEDGANGSSPDLSFWRNSASPADNDFIGKILFYGEDDASGQTLYASIMTQIMDVSNGTEDGQIKFTTLAAGANSEYLLGSDGSGASFRIPDGSHIGSASDRDAIAIAADGVVTFSQAPVFPDGSINIADLDIDGGTDIGEAITDSDLLIIDNGAGGTNRKTAASRLKTYISAGSTVALDDIITGDAASTLATSAGNITIDAQGTDTDIIFKGTDGGVDTTFLTLDGSNAGAATFNDDITVNGDLLKITGAGNKSFHVESTDAIASMEIGGTTGCFIDLKRPFSDDFDFRLASGGAGGYIQPSSGQAISILGGSGRTIATFQDQGSVVLYHNNVAKLTTTANGVDVDDINLNGKVLTITGDTSDTFTITSGAAGATTLATTDAAGVDGHLTLNADGSILLNTTNTGLLYLQDSGSNYGALYEYADNMIVKSTRSDADMLFQGNDGGSAITALTLDMSEGGDATFLGSITAPSQEYTNSLKMSFSQRYSGNATGGYFTNGEFQKIATIIPSANYENYTIIGRMAVQQGSSFQNVNFNVGLRSNALPDLDWNIFYDEDNSSSGAIGIKPQIWTKETTTAGFILAFEVTAAVQITGTVTVDFDIIPRNASRKADVTMNTVEASEQAAVDTGYTASDGTLVTSANGTAVTTGDIKLDGKVITITGDTSDTFTITAGGNGATTLATTDAAGANGHLTLNPDGKMLFDVGNDFGEFSLHRQSSMYMQIFTDNNTSGNLYIKAPAQDADIKIAGNDGGVSFNALTFDMSEAGKATFNDDVVVGDDLFFNTDGAIIQFGAGSEIDIIHVHDVGLNFKNSLTTNAGGFVLTLQSAEAEVVTGDVIGTINFQTPDESSSGDSRLVAAGIEAVAEQTFSSTANTTRLKFKTAVSETATEKMTLTGAGNLGIGTTAPSELLHIASTGDATIKLEADTDNAGGEDHNPKLELVQDGGGTTASIFLDQYNILNMYNVAAGDMRFGTSNTERMRIKFDGKTGIGTGTPLKTLHVNGPALSTVQTLTDASTVTSDFDVGQNFTLTLAGNRTLGAPSNVDAGQVGSIFIIQDGTGSRTLAYNSIWKFAGGTAPTLSTAAGAIDRLDYIVQSGTAIQALLTKAYA